MSIPVEVTRSSGEGEKLYRSILEKLTANEFHLSQFLAEQRLVFQDTLTLANLQRLDPSKDSRVVTLKISFRLNKS